MNESTLPAPGRDRDPHASGLLTGPLGSRTLANAQRDFIEWHRGRPVYVLWGLWLDAPWLVETCARAAHALAPFLLPGYARQPHVTLRVRGFPAVGANAMDDYGTEAFDADLARLAAGVASGRLGPFEIELGGLRSFASAPYLAVHDVEDGIARLREVLGCDSPLAGRGDYVPHVTVGLYGGAHDWAAILPRLAAFDAAPGRRLFISDIWLLGYAPAVIGGPLRRLHGCSLRSSCPLD